MKAKQAVTVVAVLLLLGLVVGISACSKQPVNLSAELNQPFILEPGQTAMLKNESLSVRFIEIVSDSRCPRGVQCIWAGEVAGLIEIDHQNQKKSMVLKLTGSGEADDQYTVYNIHFAVEPYPEAGKEIKPADYRLQLTISKKP